MGLFKKDAALGKRIDIRGLGLWMATQTSDPVIKVIYCYEQYVRLRRGLSLLNPEEYETQGGLKNETRHHCLATLLCGVFAQELDYLWAELLDLLQVHLMSRALIETPIKACQSIGPCAAYSINCSFAPAVALSDTCTFREEQLHYLCAAHEGGHMQGCIAIFVSGIDLSAFFEQQAHYIQLAVERRRAESGVPCFYWLIRVGSRSECLLYDGAVTDPHSGSQGLL